MSIGANPGLSIRAYLILITFTCKKLRLQNLKKIIFEALFTASYHFIPPLKTREKMRVVRHSPVRVNPGVGESAAGIRRNPNPESARIRIRDESANPGDGESRIRDESANPGDGESGDTILISSEIRDVFPHSCSASFNIFDFCFVIFSAFGGFGT